MDPTTIKIVKDYYQILVTIINELHSTQMWYQRQPTTDSEPEITSMRLQGLLCLHGRSMPSSQPHLSRHF